MSEDAAGMSAGPLRPTAIDPGTNVLIAGPAMTGKRRLTFDVLGGSPDEAAVVVTTKKSAAQIKAEFGRDRDLDRWTLSVVDCVSKQRAVGSVSETATTRYVSNAGDLTGLGIETSGVMREHYHDPTIEEARVGLHSLSTLLMYANVRRVYQFVHVLTGRIASSGFVGAFAIDTVSRDDEPVERLRQLFDAMVEVRETDRGPECRVRGGDFGPRQWTPIG